MLIVAGRDPRSELSGGHSSYVRALGRAVARAGFAPHLVCAGPTAERASTAEGAVQRVATRWHPVRQTMAPWLNRLLSRELERLADGIADPVPIHGVSLWGGAAVRAARRLRRRGRRAVAVVSSYTTYREQARSQARALAGSASYLSLRARLLTHLEHWWISVACHRYERRVYRAADAVYVHYDAIARLIARDHGPGVRCRHIAYCATAAFDDLPPAPATAVRPGEPFILSVSRADPRKANDLLIHALAELRTEGRSFSAAIVGRGRLIADQRALIDRLGLHHVVAAPGIVADIQPFLDRAALFVLSARAEQSGSLAVLEAMQRGLPIIATGVDGLLEDLRDGEDALLVPPDDAGALSAALRRLLDDPALRARLGRSARATFERRFSADAFAGALRTSYAELGVDP